MNKYILSGILICLIHPFLFAQDSLKRVGSELVLHRYEAKQAFEAESLFPLFFSKGYHVALGYRYQRFRIRASVIDGGNYNTEPAGLKNNKDEFKRFYKLSPGIFMGYNFWKNMEIYTFVEMHTFAIEQKRTGIRKDIHSDDFGGGMSYQFFFGKKIYLQPGLHLYWRSDKNADFNGQQYQLPNIDLSPVVRVGIRLWEK